MKGSQFPVCWNGNERNPWRISLSDLVLRKIRLRRSINDAEKPPWGRRLWVFRLHLLGAICHYIFTVKGLASLKLSVDSAGRTISLFPV